MSKTTNMSRRDIRWQLLVTVSAAALLASAYGASEADAADSDRPVLWIELGGQLDRLGDAQESFNPPFLSSITQANLLSALSVQQPPTYALDTDGKISFQPDGSDWLFSASIRYGRSSANKHDHQQTPNAKVPVHVTFNHRTLNLPASFYPSRHNRFTDGMANQSEIHTIVDFQAGKDVGLGVFGKRGTSVLSAGVRFAQFSSKAHVNMRAEPDLQYPTKPVTSIPDLIGFYKYDLRFHDYAGVMDMQRSFRGAGPSLSWSASVPFAGAAEQGELSLDWSINGAVLFGRQKTAGHHQTTNITYGANHWDPGNNHLAGGGMGGYFTGQNQNLVIEHQSGNSLSPSRTRSVTVPNLGGSVGFSYRIEDFKVSMGYRADFFFGAIDGGIDTHKSENRGFFGPYASVSVGIGD